MKTLALTIAMSAILTLSTTTVTANQSPTPVTTTTISSTNYVDKNSFTYTSIEHPDEMLQYIQNPTHKNAKRDKELFPQNSDAETVAKWYTNAAGQSFKQGTKRFGVKSSDQMNIVLHRLESAFTVGSFDKTQSYWDWALSKATDDSIKEYLENGIPKETAKALAAASILADNYMVSKPKIGAPSNAYIAFNLAGESTAGDCGTVTQTIRAILWKAGYSTRLISGEVGSCLNHSWLEIKLPDNSWHSQISDSKNYTGLLKQYSENA